MPQKALDELLRTYVKAIIMEEPCHTQCHGGEKSWSAAKSIAEHLPIGTVLSFDFADAFRSTHAQYVFDFYYRAFQEKIKNKEVRRDVAGFLTYISTVYYEQGTVALPQGSPVGMALFNRILYPIDELIHRQASRRRLHYTRWVDDLIISSPHRNRQPEYFLLGHKIIGGMIIKVPPEEAKNRGDPVNPPAYMTNREFENSYFLDYIDLENPEGQFDESDWTKYL